MRPVPGIRPLLFAAAVGAPVNPYATRRPGYADADFPLEAPYDGSGDGQGPAEGVNPGYRLSDLLAVEPGAARFGDLDGRATPCPVGDPWHPSHQVSAREDGLSPAGVAVG